jgi:DNA-binding PadR family transcriptional regulator
MQSHLILGLLRDGRPRHGYELVSDYQRRSGVQVSAGSFYRELARLATDRLLAMGVNPPNADARRIPYHITERGKREFDEWLVRPCTVQGEFEAWLLFVDRIAIDVRERLLERKQEDLWLRGKTLTRRRDDALAARRERRDDPEAYDPLPILLTRRIKQVAAELEFVKEVRLQMPSGLAAAEGPPGAAIGAPGERRRGGGMQRNE